MSGKDLSEGGAKDTGGALESGENEALQKENRQAVKNQGEAKPEDYPERHEQN
jgi:hypothetical protein